MNPKNNSERDKKQEAEEIRLPRKEYDELLAHLAELEGTKDKFLRSAADFDNARKRLMRERDEFVKFSQENLIRQLLPVLDNFERALAHANLPAGQGGEKENSLEGVVAGIQMVFKQLTEILKKQGLVRLNTAGQMLDPHLHEVVGYVSEEGKEDQITEEVEPGYLLHDRLLRAAKVRVRVSPASKNSGARAGEEKQEEIT